VVAAVFRAFFYTKAEQNVMIELKSVKIDVI